MKGDSAADGSGAVIFECHNGVGVRVWAHRLSIKLVHIGQEIIFTIFVALGKVLS